MGRRRRESSVTHFQLTVALDAFGGDLNAGHARDDGWRSQGSG